MTAETQIPEIGTTTVTTVHRPCKKAARASVSTTGDSWLTVKALPSYHQAPVPTPEPNQPPVAQELRATRTGWHAALAVRGKTTTTTDIIVNWLDERLRKPRVIDDEDNIVWLTRKDATPREHSIEYARHLARYCVLGWRHDIAESAITPSLTETPGNGALDQLDELTMKNQELLDKLTYQPEEMDETDRDTAAAVGDSVALILNWAPTGNAT